MIACSCSEFAFRSRASLCAPKPRASHLVLRQETFPILPNLAAGGGEYVLNFLGQVVRAHVVSFNVLFAAAPAFAHQNPALVIRGFDDNSIFAGR